MRRIRTLLVANAAMMALGASALAVDKFWNNSVGGLYQTAGNWTPSGVPGTGDNVFFELPDRYAVNFLGNIENRFLRVHDGDVTFNLASFALTLNVPFSTAAPIVVGGASGKTGRLTLAATGGGISSEGGWVGLNNGVGVVNVESGANWLNSGTLFVGGDGNGTVNVLSGGHVSTSNSVVAAFAGGTGAVSVSGTNALWSAGGTFAVGERAQGFLDITAGGRVTASFGSIGLQEGGVGDATVTGSGSRWNITNTLSVGNAGTGDLTISNGGLVTSNLGRIGQQDSGIGSAVVTGAGSRWENTGSIAVGVTGTGSLMVSDGGAVTSGSIRMGDNAGSSGSVTVSGAGSSLTITGSSSDIGDLSHGSLSILDGGLVHHTGSGTIIFVGGSVGGSASILVSGPGSRWIHDGLGILLISRNTTMDVLDGGEVAMEWATVGSSSASEVQIAGGGATFRLSDALYIGGGNAGFGANSDGTVTVMPGGVLEVQDRLKIWPQGKLNLAGGQVNVGRLEVDGTFNFAAGTLNFTSDQVYDPSHPITQVLGSDITLKPGRHLSTEGKATLMTDVIVDGGAFSSEQIVNPALLQLRKGTFNLTNQAVTVGSGGLLGSELDLPVGVTVNVTQGVTNQGLIAGGGTLGGPVVNTSTGEIRINAGQTLTFSGPQLVNEGQVRLLGGVFDARGSIENEAGGFIGGRGVLIAADGTTNAGQMAFSAGFSDIFGDLENQSGGLVMVTGGGTATFYDEVVSVAGSEFRVSAGSTAVFLGDVTGTSAFTGAGTKIFEAGTAAFASLATSGNTVVEQQASLTADTIHEQGLSIGGQVTLRAGGGASEVQTLSIEGSGRLDLVDNSILVKGGSVQAINELVKSGWAGGSWDGPGINSSAAAGEAGRAVGLRPTVAEWWGGTPWAGMRRWTVW